MIPSFQNLKTELTELESKVQELTAAVYCIVQVDDLYEFACFYDRKRQCMGFNLLCGGIEAKLFESIPTDVVLAYSDFIRAIQAYENGDSDFPYVPVIYADDNDDGDAPADAPAEPTVVLTSLRIDEE